MGFGFRSTECILVFVIILGFISKDSQCMAKKKPIQTMGTILSLLNKKNMPKFHDTILNRNLTKQLSAAKYMMNLYSSLNTLDDNSEGFNVSSIPTTKAVEGADTIMGIMNDVPDNQVKPSSFHMRFKFNFTAKIKQNESVEAAEFRIFKDIPNYPWMTNASLMVELSMITIPGNPTKLGKKLATRVIKGSETGWEVFDVTSTVDVWIVSPENNYGLELSVTFYSGDVRFPIPVDPLMFGFVGFKGSYDKRPFIVSFFKGDPTEEGVVIHASSRKRRSAIKFNPGRGGLKYGNIATECKKKHLYVDFHELRWQNWIIAPDGYESSYCAGECYYGMEKTNNSTNHAIVQTLVNLLNPHSAPSPCCAPTKLSAISVLYYDEKKNVVLKKFKDMVVKSCGCH